ncbi:TonB-dependent receptor [Fulvivirga imtechensis AK7]|uniref:TonB-dependent receptor n=1 Tax=Fulvivirga imtechensis AK7 TaxID=1237149 RepID=L8JZ41_9BACT|nr:TonB-dependent receptor [Fulvivirga imtechensis]ELR72919.1 TonB-dependent receptor [Fulvivirga imtechensis AK7]
MKLIASFFCFLTCATICAIPSYSQGNEELDEYFDMSLEELMSIEISVASKNSESFINSPSSVYVFTSAEIENMGVTSVEELLNYVPGYFTGLDIEQGKAFRVGARGRSTALSESVLFLVNGHRINDLYTGGVSVINRLIPVENIRQIEVIRGPGSSLYGSNAFLGVVNIVTKENTNDIQFSYGSFQGISAAGNFSTKAGDVDLGGFVKGFSNEGYEFDDFEDLLDRPSDMTDPEQGVDVMLRAQYKGLKAEARHHEREFKGFYGLGGVADFNNNEQSSQSMINLGYNLSASDKLAFSFKAGYRVENWKTKAVILPTGFDPGFGMMTEDFFAGPFMKSSAVNFSTDVSYKFSDANELLAGVSYEQAGIERAVSLATHDYITFEYFGGIREYHLPFNNTADKRNIVGLFIQDRHIITDNLRVTFGARLDSYSDFGSSINPRGAVVYNTPFRSTVKVMYGQAFRAPNYLELHDQNNPVDFGNTALEAEEIQTFEVAYIQNFSVFSATLTYFNNTIKNLIFLDPAAPPVETENNPLSAPSFYNLPEDVNTSGFEIATILKPVEVLSVTATYTHLMDDYTFMPENMASARINYKFGLFNLNLNGIYHGKIKEISNQNGYAVVNAKLSITSNNLTVFGRVNNIADEVYRTPTVLSDAGVVNRGRVMSLGVKVKL